MKSHAKVFSLALPFAALPLGFLPVEPAQAAPWITNGLLNLGRYSHTAALLPDGQMLPARPSTLSATSGKAGGLK